MNTAALLAIWGTVDHATTNEEALDDWWTNEHLPERLRLPGFQRARRYCSTFNKGSEKEYLTLYDATHIDDLKSDEYLEALDNPTPKTKQFMPVLAEMNRSACQVLLSKDLITQAAKHLVMLVLDWLPEDEYTLHPTLNMDKSKHPSPHILRISLVQEDYDTTLTGSSSKSYDGTQLALRHSRDGNEARKKLLALIELSKPIETTTTYKEWLDHLFLNPERRGLNLTYGNAYELISLKTKVDVTG